jgi:hypothetical protein
VDVLVWLLDSDPGLRWQVLRDLADAPPEIVAAERARVAAEGWGARILSLQGDDGQWEGGALFPAWRAGSGSEEQPKGQPWTATAYSLVLLQDLGADPHDDRVRRAVAQVREHSRWEHAGQPFFSGEVEPCINGMVVSLGAYFGLDVDGVVDRLLGEQLEDGGWNCEAENGSVRSSFHTTIRVLEGLLAHERATGGSAGSIAARRRGEEYLLERRLLRRKSTGAMSNRHGFASRFRPAGTTTCCAAWSTSGRPAIRRTPAWPKRSSCFVPSGSPTAAGSWRTPIPARSTSHSRKATAGPAGGTRCARCASSAGTSNSPARGKSTRPADVFHTQP